MDRPPNDEVPSFVCPPAGRSRPGALRFPRSARLKKQRLIRALFDSERSDVSTIAQGSIRLLYRVVPRAVTESSAPVQVAFSPGRLQRAVDRNRIKRILREVYRVNQRNLVDLFRNSGHALTLMVLLRGPEVGAENRIRRDLPGAMKTLVHRLGETSVREEQHR